MDGLNSDGTGLSEEIIEEITRGIRDSLETDENVKIEQISVKTAVKQCIATECTESCGK
jgi:RNA-binding protein YhbY